jgi:hypothetical protein
LPCGCGTVFVETSVTRCVSGSRIGAATRRNSSSSRALFAARELVDTKLCCNAEFSRHNESPKTTAAAVAAHPSHPHHEARVDISAALGSRASRATASSNLFRARCGGRGPAADSATNAVSPRSCSSSRRQAAHVARCASTRARSSPRSASSAYSARSSAYCSCPLISYSSSAMWGRPSSAVRGVQLRNSFNPETPSVT